MKESEETKTGKSQEKQKFIASFLGNIELTSKNREEFELLLSRIKGLMAQGWYFTKRLFRKLFIKISAIYGIIRSATIQIVEKVWMVFNVRVAGRIKKVSLKPVQFGLASGRMNHYYQHLFQRNETPVHYDTYICSNCEKKMKLDATSSIGQDNRPWFTHQCKRCGEFVLISTFSKI